MLKMRGISSVALTENAFLEDESVILVRFGILDSFSWMEGKGLPESSAIAPGSISLSQILPRPLLISEIISADHFCHFLCRQFKAGGRPSPFSNIPNAI